MRGPSFLDRPAKICLCMLVALAAAVSARAQSPAPRGDRPSPANQAARAWFQDARFGLFIHWGVYSLLEKDAWVMERDKLPITEYAKLPPRFNPTRFDAAAWVALAKEAGARYITITAKHHDGFCMFASNLTEYDVVDATPYHADPMRALADACKRNDIKLFFYYSLLDWRHPDYYPLGKTGQRAGRLFKGDWKRYVAYYQGQVRELCTNYGPIGGVWFDGWWDRPEADWELAGTYRMIHELQPGALVGNNHHVAPFQGEDFQMFEQDLPGDNRAGFNKAQAVRDLPLETCLTINESWGYRAGDEKYKSVKELIGALAGAAGRGANLLLNVGPRPDGAIGGEFAQRLHEMGRWLGTNGAAIYGTRKGPIAPQPWGVSTARGPADHPRAIYLHILAPRDDHPVVFDPKTPWTPRLLGSKNPLKLTPSTRGLVLEIPESLRDPLDTVVVLEPATTKVPTP